MGLCLKKHTVLGRGNAEHHRMNGGFWAKASRPQDLENRGYQCPLGIAVRGQCPLLLCSLGWPSLSPSCHILKPPSVTECYSLLENPPLLIHRTCVG